MHESAKGVMLYEAEYPGLRLRRGENANEIGQEKRTKSRINDHQELSN